MELNDETIQSVWEKARASNDRDSDEWRKDECGAWISRDQYGHEHSPFGWKIEHVAPGEPQTIEHLRPFHHENSFDKATGQPHCQITADREGLAPTASVDHPRNKTA